MSETVITVQGLYKRYGPQNVVDGVDFRVRRGECCGILGPNGAGKTTTLRMLVGNTPPSAGQITVLGYAVPAQAREMRARIGIVPQQDNLDPDFSVTENLLVYGRYFGLTRAALRQRIPGLLEFAALEHKADAPIATLSGGMKRRLTLARALLNGPDLLFLDEPTTGLDPQARQVLWQGLRRLKQRGMSLVLTTHYMEEAERLCDRLIIMDQGRILEEGAPRELIARHIEPEVVEIHGQGTDAWHSSSAARLGVRGERVGDTWFYYGHALRPLIEDLAGSAEAGLRYLHRPANLEDVFLKLTGRELRDG